MTSVPAVADRAGQWFLSSGIQSAGGGVARYYLAAERRNLPVSNEITGYAASAYAYLYERTGEPRYLDAAIRTARFLVRTAWRADLETFPFENTEPPAPAYFFDCGIIVRGLVAVWRLTREPALLDIAVRAGRSMQEDFVAAGAIHPILDLPGKTPRPYEKRWSREPGCFQLKSAAAWLQLAEATGDESFREPYERALQFALAGWRDFLPGDPDRAHVMDRLHAFCYFLEGLMPVAGRPGCGAAIREGIAWVGELLRSIAGEFERSDVNAQLLRARLYADALGACPLDERAAGEEAASAASFQQSSADPRLDGGFAFGRRAGGMLPYSNPVSTAFCTQALTQWQAQRAGRFEADLAALI